MLFNSFAFFLFFPVVTILFFLLPHRFRWLLLLAASCFFYMFFIPVYILILFATILIDYFAGIWLEDSLDQAQKKRFLHLSLVANIGILAIFKYYNFFLDNLNEGAVLLFDHPTALRYLGIALPVGLSFHTFQAMSYTFEVYNGRQKAERHFGIYALYVMFYPQLVAGPIERPQNILHQFREKQVFNHSQISAGLSLMIWGLFKKVVIADNLSVFVDSAYVNPEQAEGLALLLTSYLFAIQIYCDFSGYSDIAIGAAKTMGFTLMENFRTPYLATSIREFWARWHISLSTWFRDYLYIPLGGNRTSRPRWMFNLFFVFAVSGFWHGANWTFIIWGILHGSYLVAGILKDSWIQGKPSLEMISQSCPARLISWIITFHLVVFAWVFFRAETLQDALTILQKIFSLSLDKEAILKTILTLSEQSKNFGFVIFVIVISGVFMLIDPWMDRLTKNPAVLPSWKRYLVFALLTAGLLLFGYFGDVSFIYFQF